MKNIYIYIRIWKINTSSTIIPAYATYMKTLPRVTTREWIYPLLQGNYVNWWEPTEAQLWLVKLGVVRSGFLVRWKKFIHASQCHIVPEFFTALNHLKHCCYMPIAWLYQALTESFCHRGQAQSWWGTLRKQSFLLLRTNTSMTAYTHWATQIFGLGQSECGVTIRHIGRA